MNQEMDFAQTQTARALNLYFSESRTETQTSVVYKPFSSLYSVTAGLAD